MGSHRDHLCLMSQCYNIVFFAIHNDEICDAYSRAHLIHTANVWENHVNYQGWVGCGVSCRSEMGHTGVGCI